MTLKTTEKLFIFNFQIKTRGSDYSFQFLIFKNYIQGKVITGYIEYVVENEIIKVLFCLIRWKSFTFYRGEMRVFLTNLFVHGHARGFAPVDKRFSNPEGSERYI